MPLYEPHKLYCNEDFPQVLDPDLEQEMQRGGMKLIADEDGTGVWYHPDHWVAWNALGGEKPPKGHKAPGATWIFDFAFDPISDEAKKYLEEDMGELIEEDIKAADEMHQ